MDEDDHGTASSSMAAAAGAAHAAPEDEFGSAALDAESEILDEDAVVGTNDAGEGVDVLDENDASANKGPGLIPEKDRMMTKYMTKYEKARVLGMRALQISMNAPVMVPIDEGEYDPLKIAEKELRAEKVGASRRCLRDAPGGPLRGAGGGSPPARASASLARSLARSSPPPSAGALGH